MFYRNTRCLTPNIKQWQYMWGSAQEDCRMAALEGRKSSCTAVTCSLNSVAAVAVMWTDSVYSVCSPSTGTSAISLGGSGPVIVMSSKNLGGPHTHTDKKRQETAGTRKYNYVKFLSTSSLNTCCFFTPTEGYTVNYTHVHINISLYSSLLSDSLQL